MKGILIRPLSTKITGCNVNLIIKTEQWEVLTQLLGHTVPDLIVGEHGIAQLGAGLPLDMLVLPGGIHQHHVVPAQWAEIIGTKKNQLQDPQKKWQKPPINV